MSEETKPEKPKTLVQKLCEVMGAVGYLQKTGTNSKQNYKYAKEADVVAAMRPELAKRGIFIFPNVISVQRNKVERLDFDKSLKFSWATDILVEWTIEDGETGETRKCIIPGCSESPGDKGVYVAMTGSEKYLLMKGFLLPTGDDPESDANEENGSRQAAKAVAAKKLGVEPQQLTAADTLFYMYPPRHQGNRVELTNLSAYENGIDPIAVEALHGILRQNNAHKKADGTVWLDHHDFLKVKGELEKCAVQLGEVRANA